jgi:hypothetical protein
MKNGSRLAAAASLAILAACSGGTQGPASSLPASPAHRGAMPATSLPQFLYVSNGSNEIVYLDNSSYKEAGTVTDDISNPAGLWVGIDGNLYVANANDDVDEFYAPTSSSGASLKCSYTGATDPVALVENSSPFDVFVVDAAGYIDEYPQCVNTIRKQWTIPGTPTGVAVSKTGAMFVSYETSSGGAFEEFKRNSTTGIVLGATVGKSGGLVRSKGGILIAGDQSAGTIDVIAPPYKTVKVLASGLSDPVHCSLNQDENLLFSANAGNNTVTVYDYPSGTLVTTLGSSNGLSAVNGVAESPDAVF